MSRWAVRKYWLLKTSWDNYQQGGQCLKQELGIHSQSLGKEATLAE